MSGYLNINDCDLALFCAFRYALGRSTYIVDDVADLIIRNKDKIEENTKRQITSEIRYALDTETLGMACDRLSWDKVHRELTGLSYENSIS